MERNVKSCRTDDQQGPVGEAPEVDLASATISHPIGDLVQGDAAEGDDTAASDPHDVAIENAPFDYLSTYCVWEKVPEELQVILEQGLPPDLFTEPALSHDEERALFQTIKRGGPEGEKARERFMSANLRLVRTVVGHLQPLATPAMSLEDLFQEGVAALAYAVDHYDPEKYPDIRFFSYAKLVVDHGVRRALRNLGDTVRRPIEQHSIAWKVLGVAETLQTKLERPPTYGELAKEIRESGKFPHLTAFRIHDLFSTGVFTKIPAAYAPEREHFPNLHPAGATATHSAEKLEQITFVAAHLESCAADLSGREKSILRLRYPSNPDEEPKTLEEIGAMYGFTRERIRQLEAQALKTLSFRMRHILGENPDLFAE